MAQIHESFREPAEASLPARQSLGDATEKGECAQRDDQRRHLPAGDEQAVERAAQGRHQNDERDCDPQRNPRIVQLSQDDGREPHERTQRQGDQPEVGVLAEDGEEVLEREEILAEQAEDPDLEEQNQNQHHLLRSGREVGLRIAFECLRLSRECRHLSGTGVSPVFLLNHGPDAHATRDLDLAAATLPIPRPAG